MSRLIVNSSNEYKPSKHQPGEIFFNKSSGTLSWTGIAPGLKTVADNTQVQALAVSVDQVNETVSLLQEQLENVVDNLGTAVLPPQSGQTGKFLTTNGTTVSWASAGQLANVSSADIEWEHYSSEAQLPSAAEKHGMFAHVHGTGHGYMAHAGQWVKLANYTDLPQVTVGTVATGTTNGTTGTITFDGTYLNVCYNTNEWRRVPVLPFTANLVTDAQVSTLLNNYVTSTGLTVALNNYVTGANLSSALNSYITSSSLTSTLTGYVTSSALTSALASYATSSSLSNYVTSSSLTSTLNNYATTSTLSTYATTASLASYVTSSSLTSTLSSYLTTTDAGNTYVSNSSLTSTLNSYLTTASAASTYATTTTLNNRVPVQTGYNGKFLTTNGTSSSWGDLPNSVSSIRTTATSNVDFGTSWASVNTTYYKWDLPVAGDYIVWCTLRARNWGTNGFGKVRLYNASTATAVTNTETMLIEQQNSVLLNTMSTSIWKFTATGATTLVLQGSASTSGSIGIQSDANGYNEFGYVRIT